MDMYAKTQKVDARMNGSGNWNTDVPNIKLSRAFVVVLILHVVAVGGILAFEMFKADPPGDVAAQSGGMAQLDAGRPAGLVGDEEQQSGASGLPVASDDGRDDGYLRYIVQSGDNLHFIAAAYNISRTALLAANNIDESHPLVPGRILRIPRTLLSLTDPDLIAGASGQSYETDDTQGEEDNGFILLKSAGGITDLIDQPDTQPGEFLPLTTAQPKQGGFVPLAEVPAPEGQGAAVSKPVKRTVRPKVLRERPATAHGESKRSPISASQHTVVGGDTLYGIARKYGVSVNDMLAANPGVSARSLRIGKTLRIP